MASATATATTLHRTITKYQPSPTCPGGGSRRRRSSGTVCTLCTSATALALAATSAAQHGKEKIPHFHHHHHHHLLQHRPRPLAQTATFTGLVSLPAASALSVLFSVLSSLFSSVLLLSPEHSLALQSHSHCAKRVHSPVPVNSLLFQSHVSRGSVHSPRIGRLTDFFCSLLFAFYHTD